MLVFGLCCVSVVFLFCFVQCYLYSINCTDESSVAPLEWNLVLSFNYKHIWTKIASKLMALFPAVLNRQISITPKHKQ